jgi:transcriptional regulator with XRE-family HTH domain
MYRRLMSAPILPDTAERSRPHLALVSSAAPAPSTPPLRRRGERAAVDAHLGVRMRMRRTLLGIGQQQLAVALGISYQQVRNYECGANRISASTLWELSCLLDVPVSFFFDDMAPQPQPAAIATTPNDKALMRRQTLELVRAFYAVPETARNQLFDFVKSMARTLTQRP